ncbi:MAG TPA: holo-ACP synthase [Blastocatellia bacterium]|nr:holo-ACP synthase [Blastocatellia bacterium]
MIVATGIDLVEIARIRRALETHGARFRNRVFTLEEIEYSERQGARFASYAARFAAKEAVMKALGTGWAAGVRWLDIEVRRSDAGAPTVYLSGRALEILTEKGVRKAHLSLSHSDELAIAQVILET